MSHRDEALCKVSSERMTQSCGILRKRLILLQSGAIIRSACLAQGGGGVIVGWHVVQRRVGRTWVETRSRGRFLSSLRRRQRACASQNLSGRNRGLLRSPRPCLLVSSRSCRHLDSLADGLSTAQLEGAAVDGLGPSSAKHIGCRVGSRNDARQPKRPRWRNSARATTAGHRLLAGQSKPTQLGKMWEMM